MPGHVHSHCPKCGGCIICYPHTHGKVTYMDKVSAYPDMTGIDFDPRPHWERTAEYKARANAAFGKG